ncbi:MAG: Ig-like domain-containing protein [Actinomycetota bacterium]|nr:Ig-like domain-containing protein [Actinomycetota bacterium]
MRLVIMVALSLLAFGGHALAADPVVDAVGDMGCAPADANYNGGNGVPSAVYPAHNCVQKTVSDLVAGSLPTALLDLGDNQYNNGELNNYKTVYDATFGRANSEVYPSLGNAEYYTANASGFFGYFGSVTGVFSRIQADGGDNSHLTTGGYYSLSVGGWHVIALNSNCVKITGGCGTGSPEEQWLKADLAAHSGLCTLAYWHHPRWNSGSLGNDPSSAAFWTDLYAAHADVVLNGHGNHHYERFLPQNPSGAPDPAGIREFIVSTGGQSHGSPPTAPGDRNTSQITNYTDYGVLQLNLHPTGYDWQFLPAAGGAFTDSGSGACHSATTPPPQPVVTSVGPGDGATGVYPNTVVYEVFSAPMDQAATQAAFSLRPTSGGGPVSGSFSWFGPTAMIFTPNSDLGTGVQYTASVSTAAKDQNGNPLAAAKTWHFTTINQPVIEHVSPAVGATGVGTGSPVYAIFSQPMDHPSTAAAFTVVRASDNSPVAGSVVWYGDTAPIFVPSSALAPNTTYTANVAGSAMDQSGRTLANPTSWQFTTGATAQANVVRWSVVPGPVNALSGRLHPNATSPKTARQPPASRATVPRRTPSGAMPHPISEAIKRLEHQLLEFAARRYR